MRFIAELMSPTSVIFAVIALIFALFAMNMTLIIVAIVTVVFTCLLWMGSRK